MGQVRLLYPLSFSPFAFTEEGSARGLVIDLLVKILSRFSLETLFLPSRISEIETQLRSQKADAIACHGITPDRRMILDFSDPLVVTGAGFFIDSSMPEVSESGKGEGKRIVTPGTGPLVTYLKRSFPKAKLLLAEDYPESLRIVLDGEADAAALNIHVGKGLADRLFPGRFTVPQKMLFEVPLGVAVLKGSQTGFLSQVNVGLRDIREDGSYEEILKKWIPPS